MIPMKNLQPAIEGIRLSLEGILGETWKHEDFNAHLSQLVTGSDQLFALFSEAGDLCYSKLTAGEKPSGEETFLCLLIHHQWAPNAKAYMILWRDVLFQEQKSQLLLLEGEASPEAVAHLKKEAFETVAEAAAWLKNNIELEASSIQRSRGGSEKIVAKWNLQNNPWPTYREQLSFIPKQCRGLEDQFNDLVAVSSVFNKIRKHIQSILESCLLETASSEAAARKAIGLIAEESKTEKEANLKTIAARLDEVEREMVLTQHFNFFSLSLEDQLAAIPEKMQVAIGTQGGNLQQLDINLRKRTRQWVESEILPLLYEVWELTENVGNGMKMSLMNIRNRAILLSAGTNENSNIDFEKAALSQPLQSFLANISKARSQMEGYVKQISDRAILLKASHIYQPEQFLFVSQQTTINRLTLDQGKMIDKLKSWWLKSTLHVRRLIKSVEEEESLSISERVVRYVRHRETDEKASPYTSIFLTKGYIGISFAVGREDELRHVKNVVDNWKAGYRGAISITGKRLSGKTLFGELAAARFFADNNIIRLFPGSILEVQGRKFEATHDLKAALDFVRKHTLTTRPLIWMDDLELWWDPSIPLYQNVRALIEYVDDYSDQIFFMVSMSNFLKSHLQQSCQINRIFQADIRMDYISVDAVHDAILVRHGATHKKLVDKENQEISPQAFRKNIAAIHKRSSGNIGEALNEWASSIRLVDEDTVTPSFESSYSLPDCLNETTGMLTAQIVLQKRTNEYRLRKQFGPAFQEKYLNVLQRLIHIGLLRRQLDGWLEVNDIVVNELGRMLVEKNYLKGD